MSQLLFPTLSGLTWPVSRVPLPPPVRTKRTASLRQFKTREATVPLYRFTLSFSFLRKSQAQQDWQTLMGFVNQVGGDFDDFLFEDIDDRAVTAQTFATGNGVQTAFQLARTLGGFLEPVYGPLTTAFTVNGTPTAATVSNFGLVTFAAAPAAAAVIRWTGTFAWRCQFDRDGLEFIKNDATFYSARAIRFSSIVPL